MAKEKNTKIVSLSLDPEMHEMIRGVANKLGHKNVSQLIRDLVSKYIDLMLVEEDEISVVLRIPGEVHRDRAKLNEWLRVKSEAISGALSK
jgi:Arc/MetJ-type ribon-helix-helix transcriptional regulator